MTGDKECILVFLILNSKDKKRARKILHKMTYLRKLIMKVISKMNYLRAVNYFLNNLRKRMCRFNYKINRRKNDIICVSELYINKYLIFLNLLSLSENSIIILFHICILLFQEVKKNCRQLQLRLLYRKFIVNYKYNYLF